MTDKEREYGEALAKALELGVLLTVSGSTMSREHGFSYQRLQEAELWHDKDKSEKEYRQMQREANPPG